MKTILIISMMFMCFCANSQDSRSKPKFMNMERCLDSNGDPIADCGLLSGNDGKFKPRNLAYMKSHLGIVTQSFTQGSILFADVDGTITEDNSNLFYNNPTNRVGINKNTSLRGALDISADPTNPSLVFSDLEIEREVVSFWENGNDKLYSINVGSNREFEIHMFNDNGTIDYAPFIIDRDNLTTSSLRITQSTLQTFLYDENRPFDQGVLNLAGFDAGGNWQKYSIAEVKDTLLVIQSGDFDELPVSPIDGDRYYYTVDDNHYARGWYYYDAVRSAWLGDAVYEIEFEADSLYWNGFNYLIVPDRYGGTLNQKMVSSAIRGVTFTGAFISFENNTTAVVTFGLIESVNELAGTECVSGGFINGFRKTCEDLNANGGLSYRPYVTGVSDENDITHIKVKYFYRYNLALLY